MNHQQNGLDSEGNHPHRSKEDEYCERLNQTDQQLSVVSRKINDMIKGISQRQNQLKSIAVSAVQTYQDRSKGVQVRINEGFQSRKDNSLQKNSENKQSRREQNKYILKLIQEMMALKEKVKACEIEEKYDESQNQKTKIKQLETRVKEYEHELSLKDEEFQSAVNQSDALKLQIARKEENISSLNNQVKELRISNEKIILQKSDMEKQSLINLAKIRELEEKQSIENIKNTELKQRYQKQVQSLKKKVSQLKEQNDKALKSLSISEKGCSELKESIKRIEDEVSKSNSQSQQKTQRLEKIIDELKRSSQQIQSENQKIISDYTHKNKEQEEKLGNLEKTRANYEKKYEQKMKENQSKFNEANQNYKRLLQAKNKSIDDFQNLISVLEQENNKFKSIKTALEKQNQSLKKSTQPLEKQNERLKEQIITFEKEIEKNKSLIEKDREQASQKMEQKQSQIHEANEKRKNIESQLSLMKEEFEKILSENQMIKSHIEIDNKSKEVSSDKEQQYKEESIKNTEKIKSLSNEIELQKNERKRLEKDLGTNRREFEQLKVKYQNNKETLKTLEATKQLLENEKSHLEKQIEKLKSENKIQATQKQNFKNLHQDFISLTKSFQKIHSDNKIKEKQVQELKQMIKQNQSHILKSLLDEKTELINSLSSQISSQATILNEMSQSIKLLQDQNKQKEEQINLLTSVTPSFNRDSSQKIITFKNIDNDYEKLRYVEQRLEKYLDFTPVHEDNQFQRKAVEELKQAIQRIYDLRIQNGIAVQKLQEEKQDQQNKFKVQFEKEMMKIEQLEQKLSLRKNIFEKSQDFQMRISLESEKNEEKVIEREKDLAKGESAKQEISERVGQKKPISEEKRSQNQEKVHKAEKQESENKPEELILPANNVFISSQADHKSSEKIEEVSSPFGNPFYESNFCTHADQKQFQDKPKSLPGRPPINELSEQKKIPGLHHLKIERTVSIEEVIKKDFCIEPSPKLDNRNIDFSEERPQKNRKMTEENENYHKITPIASRQEYLMNQSSNSVYNADHIHSLSEENKKLKAANLKMTEEFNLVIQILSKLHIKWERLKEHSKPKKFSENLQEEQQLINTSQLQQNINLIIQNKEKMLKQFDHNDFEAFCAELSKIIEDTKKWIELIENLTNENKIKSLRLIMMKGQQKCKKRKTLKNGFLDIPENWIGNHHCNYDNRSVCSEGHTPSKFYPDIDISPFEMLDEINPHHNSLERLFSDNQALSQISSVKEHSQNSGFFNSRSELARMFEKAELKEHSKKDIVDDYVVFNKEKFKETKDNKNKPIQTQTQPAQPAQLASNQKNSQNLQKKGKDQSHAQIQAYCDLIPNNICKNFEERSNKSKRKLYKKTIFKMEKINERMKEEQKNSNKIIKEIIQKYEEKIKRINKELKSFMQTMAIKGKRMNFNLVSQNEGGTDFKNQLLNENNQPLIDERDQIVDQRIETLQNALSTSKEEMDKKQKIISEKSEQITELQKKLKDEKICYEKLMKKLTHETELSNGLNEKITKIEKDFKDFMERVLIKQKNGDKEYIDVGTDAIEINNYQKKSKTDQQNDEIIGKSEDNENQQNFEQASLKAIRYHSEEEDHIKLRDIMRISENSMPEMKEKKEEQPRMRKSSSSSSNNMSSSGYLTISVENTSQSQTLSNALLKQNPMSISRKKSFSEAPQKQKINYYANFSKNLKQDIKKFLQTQFSENKIEQNIEQVPSLEDKKRNSQGRRTNSIINGNKDEKKEQKEKERDEKIILDDISTLKKKLKEEREEVKDKNKLKIQRLFDLIKIIIQQFKISYKSFNKCINSLESGENYTVYIQLRQFLKETYQNLQKNQIPSEIRVSRLYESFEEKMQYFKKQLQSKQEELEQKNKQILALKEEIHEYEKLEKKLIHQKSTNSIRSNNEDQFYQFEKKEVFDNTKPMVQEFEALKIENERNKQKIDELEKIVSTSNQKKNEKIYRRR